MSRWIGYLSRVITSHQRSLVEAYLRAVGWLKVDGVLTAPSGGLWLLDAHFGGWEPSEMAEIFKSRAKRIREQGHEGCEEAALENEQVCAALTTALSTSTTERRC